MPRPRVGKNTAPRFPGVRPGLLFPLLLLLFALSACMKNTEGPLPSPEIRSITPGSGCIGTLVSVEGEGFGAERGTLLLGPGAVPTTDILSWWSDRVRFWVPPGAVTGDVRISRSSDGVGTNGRPFTVTGPDPTPPERPGLATMGSLSGKRVVISPGHGYYYDTGLSAWTTQRPNLWGLIEDRHNNEIAMDFLIPMLEKAGARVLSCRERSRQTNETILDDGNGAPAYTETGSWTTTTATGTGYGGTDYRVATASAAETATATWNPAIPAEGLYPVYVWYRAGANRCTDALYVVHHGGGASEVRVNQRIFGSRWFHIGDFRFAAGSSGRITLSNRSGDAGCFVIADAVRVGAGQGSLVRGGGTSGQPRWKECARYWTEFMGAPPSVWNLGMSDRNEDITCRAHYADWMEDEWQGQGGAVYLSLHTNAAGSPNTGTGTDTFIHDTAPSPGSAAFQSILHAQVINDIRARWKSDWTDRGQKVANFGELRETDDMPAVLIEIAFHDTQTPDNDFLHEDEFRRDVARALYKGISKYLAPGGAIAPLPPTHLCVRSLPHGRIRVSWRAPSDPLEGSASATGYVVYAGRDGVAFDNGREVTGATSVEIGRLTPGDVHYFRVTARNAGGESRPSEVLCARARFDETVPVLLVNGFDRLDRWVTLRRGENTFDYVRRHARALADAASHPFDSASNEAVVDGDVALGDYVLADWILGEESTADETFSDAEQALVAAHLASGGRILVTGAEVAWDLGAQGSAADRAFLSSSLCATYRLDTPGAGIRTVEPVSGSFLEGMAPFEFDDGTHGTYDVDWPDVFDPCGAGQAVLHYAGGAGYVAGIAWVDGATGSRGVLLGFPLETVYDPALRTELVSRLLAHLLP